MLNYIHKNGDLMTKNIDEYTEASNILEKLLIKDFDLLAELYCLEIADALWLDFMKDRTEDEQTECCLQADIDAIKTVMIQIQLQIAKIAMILNFRDPQKEENVKLKDLDDCIKELTAIFGK